MRAFVGLAWVAWVMLGCDGGEGSLDAAATPDGAAPDMSLDAAPGPDAAVDAAADAAPDLEPDAFYASTLEFPVDGPGPFAVGFRTLEVAYAVPGTGEARTIVVDAWYPARAVEGEHPRFLNLFDDDESVIDAPARPPVGEAYPVMVYSHGDRGFGGTSAFLMAHFASHGWLAVAPDHIGNLLTDNPRGELVAHFVERPADISATLDALEALPADDPLSRGDVSRVVLSGHSRGVYTVWASAGAAYDLEAIAAGSPEVTEGERSAFAAGLGDPRVVAGIGLAGGYRERWFGAEGWRAVAVPLQFHSGSADNPDALRAMFDRVDGLDLVWLELAEACHQTFALGICPTFDKELGFHIVEAHALAFARRHLLGDGDPRTVGIVEGEVAIDPAVTVRRR